MIFQKHSATVGMSIRENPPFFLVSYSEAQTMPLDHLHWAPQRSSFIPSFSWHLKELKISPSLKQPIRKSYFSVHDKLKGVIYALNLSYIYLYYCLKYDHVNTLAPVPISLPIAAWGSSWWVTGCRCAVHRELCSHMYSYFIGNGKVFWFFLFVGLFLFHLVGW